MGPSFDSYPSIQPATSLQPLVSSCGGTVYGKENTPSGFDVTTEAPGSSGFDGVGVADLELFSSIASIKST